MPFCAPNPLVQSKSESLGEAIQGYELVQSNLQAKFKKDTGETSFCHHEKLSKDDYDKLHTAVTEKFWYELFIDDLPVWGYVGSSSNDKLEIYTHMKFTILYNGKNIIEVKLENEKPVSLAQDMDLEFTYSIEWKTTEKTFANRFDAYLDNSFFEHQIHWFSIFNSFMMVIFLVGVVSMILMRTLKKDYVKFSEDIDEEDPADFDESGWKQVHADVFRAPPHLGLFSALIGTGTQLIALIFFVILLAIGYYHQRGKITSTFIACYAVTSFIGGYIGGSIYVRNGGKRWIRTLLVTITFLPGIILGIIIPLNVTATSYNSLSAIPVTTIIIVIAIWGFVAFPLTLIGTVVGRNWTKPSDHPCRISPVPRSIPEKKWYQEPITHIILGGLLPFGSIFIEMNFVFTAMWQYMYYYVFGFLFLVFVLLIAVIVCTSIVSTYFLLNSEDYRWHWTSFLSSASTAAYVFLYSVYYFYDQTRMTGFLQTIFYFGYTSMFCIVFGLVCGAIGYHGASFFVRRIYGVIKID